MKDKAAEDRDESPRRVRRDVEQILRERYAGVDLQGHPTILAFVAARKEELAEEFWQWFGARAQVGERAYPDGMMRWERERFGDVLVQAAHGVLAFVVKSKLQHTPAERREDPFWASASERLEYEHAVESNHAEFPRKLGEGSLACVRRIAEVVAGRLAPAAKPMPALGA